jgi:hypothetical protein
MKHNHAAALALLTLLAACTGGAPEPPAQQAATVDAAAARDLLSVADAQARAEAAIADFGTRLRGALQARMQTDGPLGAVDFCFAQAPGIADAVMAEHDVRLGRTSTRVRNPANAANDWQARVLESFAADVAAGQAPQAQRAVLTDNLPGDVALRFMKGIRVEATCLLCHGGPIDPSLAAALAERYPDDAAVGYAEGDLRGAFWVEVPSGAR